MMEKKLENKENIYVNAVNEYFVENLKKCYDKEFESRIQEFRYFDSNNTPIDTYIINGVDPTLDFAYIVEKMSGDYLGGMVGKKGGFLTSAENGEMVGDVAFALLEFGYEILVTIVKQCFGKEPEEGEKNCNEFAKQLAKIVLGKEYDNLVLRNIMTEEVKKFYDIKCEKGFNSFCMLPREVLEGAFYKTKADCNLEQGSEVTYCDGELEKFIPELKNLKSEAEWERCKNNISVIKVIVWNLIEEYLKLEIKRV